MPDNLAAGELGAKAWEGADAASALAKAYEVAEQSTLAAERWYFEAKRAQGLVAKALRLVALLCFGVGGVIPMARGLLGGVALPTGVAWNDVGYVALAAGAGLLGFDYFFGFSSAYTRFVTTALAIHNARARFHADWLALISKHGGLRPDTPTGPFLDRLQEFVATTLQLVERETQEWVAEFRSSLSEMEKLGNKAPARLARPAPAPGDDLEPVAEKPPAKPGPSPKVVGGA